MLSQIFKNVYMRLYEKAVTNGATTENVVWHTRGFLADMMERLLARQGFANKE